VTAMRVKPQSRDIAHLSNRMVSTAFLSALLSIMATTFASAQSRGTVPKSFFLVASRNLPDPVFQQSVILVLPPDESPIVAGVIINKPTDMTLDKLLKLPLAPEKRNQKVYFGGPVDISSPLMLLRTTHPPKGGIQLWTNLYGVADIDSIGDILKESQSGLDARFYLGRAQWAPDQLRGELLEGAWTVLPVQTDLIFEHDSGKVWPTLSRHEHVREIMADCSGDAGMFASANCGGFVW
jgi:putative transcriptional regulator